MGSREEMEINQLVRRGTCAVSARATTVLLRAARTAGTNVAITATTNATPVTTAIVYRLNDGAGAPISPTLGSGDSQQAIQDRSRRTIYVPNASDLSLYEPTTQG